MLRRGLKTVRSHSLMDIDHYLKDVNQWQSDDPVWCAFRLHDLCDWGRRGPVNCCLNHCGTCCLMRSCSRWDVRSTYRLSQWPARWYSGESVRIAVGRPGVHSLSRVIPKDLKNGIHSFPAWCSAWKRDSVKNKPASLLVVSLGKALNGTPPPLCGGQVALPYFTGL